MQINDIHTSNIFNIVTERNYRNGSGCLNQFEFNWIAHKVETSWIAQTVETIHFI